MFDTAVRRVLELDPSGVVIFLEGRDKSWAEALQKRLGAHDRVIFLPRLSGEVYADMLLSADVMLDTFPYSGFTTSVEALSLGLPVVTRSGAETIRGSQTLALLRALDKGFGQARVRGPTLTSRLVALDIEEYAILATRAAGVQSRTYRDRLRRDINSVSPKLFGDEGAVQDWATFLNRVRAGN